MAAELQGETLWNDMDLTALRDIKRRTGRDSAPKIHLSTKKHDNQGGSGDVRRYDGLAQALIEGDRRLDNNAPYAVVGGPGTGKTSLLLEILVNFLENGGSPESVMLITPSKEAADQFRRHSFSILSERGNIASSGTFVRSIHSWAFALYRQLCSLEGHVAPRLLTGAEHDIMIRDLLHGIAQSPEDFPIDWPQAFGDSLKETLGMVGFSRQLRDLLLRAQERGISAEYLQELGRIHQRDIWVAAGQFLEHFERVRNLSEVQDLNASELLHTVVTALDSKRGESLLRRFREQKTLILVDDAHNLDPAAARFVELFIHTGARTVIAGDVDQCVFHFRGADERFLTRYAERETHRIVLNTSYRLSPQQGQAVALLQKKLPAVSVARQVFRSASADSASGSSQEESLKISIAGSVTAERVAVADFLRRAHVEADISWNDMAVIVRSLDHIAPLRRALLNHGVPVRIDSTSIVLAEQPLVKQLLLLAETAYRTLYPAEIRRIMESSLVGADSVTMRSIERSVAMMIRSRRVLGETLYSHDDGTPWQAMDYISAYVQSRRDNNGELLVDEDFIANLRPHDMDIVTKVAHMIDAVTTSAASSHTVEMILWEAWQATGLDRRMQTQALRGGVEGAQADQALDAVMNLFDLAGNFVESTPMGTLGTFISEVRAQELPTNARLRSGVIQEAVEILPAHAAVGRQWSIVAVSGVQEDTWPTGPTVGGLFGQAELVDLIDRGNDPSVRVSRVAEAVQEERRLFLLAISRSSWQTLVTAVQQEAEDVYTPSRFIEEIAEASTPYDVISDDSSQLSRQDSADVTVHNLMTLTRVLSVENFSAELRAVVTDEHRPMHERQVAAHNLWKLAQVGVYEAHPDHWWGTREASSTCSVVNTDGQVSLSPSKLEQLLTEPLEWFMDNASAIHPSTTPLRIGSAIHAIAEAFIHGEETCEDGIAAMKIIVPHLVDGPAGNVQKTIATWEEGLNNLHKWLQKELPDDAELRAKVRTEETLRVSLGEINDPVTGESISVILSGRTDLLLPDREIAGRTIIVDFKTGGSVLSKGSAEKSPQLTAYQLLIHYGDVTEPGEARLVYVRKPQAKEILTSRSQEPISGSDWEGINEEFLSIAKTAIGPQYPFLVNATSGDNIIRQLSLEWEKIQKKMNKDIPSDDTCYDTPQLEEGE